MVGKTYMTGAEMTKTKKLTKAILLSTALASSLPLQAALAQQVNDDIPVQNAGDEVELKEVLVIGNRLGTIDPEIVKEHEGTRDVLSQETWKKSSSATVKEALRQVPGLQIPENNGTGSGDFALNIGIRGLGSRLTSRATVLLDGIPLANAPYGQPQTSLAPVALGNLQAIDIVKGGSSVRFGPQNVGGVINFITKDIPDDFEVTTRIGGDYFSGGAANNLLGNYGFTVGDRAENGAGIALLYSGQTGNGFRDNDFQNNQDVILKYELPVGDDGLLSGRFHYFRSRSDLPGPLTRTDFNSDPFQSTHSFERFEGERGGATLKYIHNFSDTYEFEIGGFITDSQRDFTIANGNDSSLTRLDFLPRDYRVYGLESRFSGLTTTGVLDHEWSIGYRLVLEDSQEFRFRRQGFGAGGDPFSVDAIENRNTDGRTVANAFYVDNRITWGKFSLTPGLRFEHVDLERENNLNVFTDKEVYNEFLPSVNLGYQATDNWLFYANYGESFGAVGFLALSASGNSTIDPERARTYEVGARFSGKGVDFNTTFYQIDFDNQIAFDRNVGFNVNTGSTRHRGVEASLYYELANLHEKLDGFSIQAAYAFTDATFQNGDFVGNDLPLFSRHIGSLGFNYAIDTWKFNVTGYLQSRQFADEENTVAENADGDEGIIPGFNYWNIGGSKTFEIDDAEATLNFGVKNIFDERYFTRASVENNGGIFAGAPRSFYLELNTKF